ncbi:uncharacterized protein [Montipora capricornis]|uniref:uncharacterized protein n=1 Tax=Montipora capricornis TaxID=246305 RepID=UPI0035F209FE
MDAFVNILKSPDQDTIVTGLPFVEMALRSVPASKEMFEIAKGVACLEALEYSCNGTVSQYASDIIDTYFMEEDGEGLREKRSNGQKMAGLPEGRVKMQSKKERRKIMLTSNEKCLQQEWHSSRQSRALPVGKGSAVSSARVGEEALEIYNTFRFATGEDPNKIAHLKKKFEDYFNPRKNTVFERYKFWECKQKDSEFIDQFITELKTRAKSCEIGHQQDSLIRDRIVFGVSSTRLKERLLRESSDLTLEKAVSLCRAAEASAKQLKELQTLEKVPVHAIKPRNKPTKASPATSKTSRQLQQFNCKNCGTKHYPRSCLAFGRHCHICKGKHHYAKMYPQKNSRVHTVTPSLDGVIGRQCEVQTEEFFIGTVTGVTTDSAWFSTVTVGGSSVKFKLDAGAEANVLPLSVYSELQNKSPLMDTSVVFFLVWRFQDLVKRVESVAQAPRTKKEIVDKFADVFSGLDCMKGEYYIELDDSVQPVIHPPRRIPYSLLGKPKAKLQELEEKDFVQKVNRLTPWVNSLVIVEKRDGSLRLCLDPRDLNKAIRREHHRIPTAEDIASHLSGKKVFSIVDEKDGFWQVCLGKESSHLCTFNSPFGRYRFYGIRSAPEVFQKRNEARFGDIDGVEVIFDDIIVAATDEKEHDETMLKLLERARQANVKFNPAKLQYKVSEVKYMGNIVSESGLKPDIEKVRAITQLPLPQSKEDLQRFLGMPVKLQVDASKSGLGSCVLQDGLPIAYASRSLTQAEEYYAQIDKELLAVVLGCERFNHYFYGRPVDVESDYKPLVSVNKKPLTKVSPRLQCLLLRLQKYEVNITYVPGKYMYVADTLSRAHLDEPPSEQELSDDMEVIVHTLVERLPMSKEKLAQMKAAIAQDEILQMLSKVYPELCLLRDKTAGPVITGMKSMYARHGIPDEVIADNMPFSSKEFHQLQRIGDLKSPPRIPDTHSQMG